MKKQNYENRIKELEAERDSLLKELKIKELVEEINSLKLKISNKKDTTHPYYPFPDPTPYRPTVTFNNLFRNDNLDFIGGIGIIS